MRNNYVGDIGDFGKYGLLRALCSRDEHGSDLKLGVVWYFVSERGFEYLSEDKRRNFMECDDDLYAKLEQIVQARSLASVQDGDVLPSGTVFFDEKVNNRSTREDWLERAMENIKDCEVIFLDPNTGLRVPPRGGSDARSSECAYLDEVSEFAEHEGNRSVVIYDHLGQKRGDGWTHDDEIAEQLTQLRSQFAKRSPFAMRFRPYSPRAFFVLPALAHEERLVRRAQAMVDSPWGEGKDPHFQFVPGK